ncbi:MAG: glycosyltransferase family 4 protein [Lachnospiraceae bacterium]|nr:glycosyltransferase family 4 protein [Lachnospiraceae bacterium]
MLKPHVVMVGLNRKFQGGMAAVVNSYYTADLDKRVKLTYISTIADVSSNKIVKLLYAIRAFLCFLLYLPSMDILHVHTASNASYYRKKVFVETASFFRKKIVIHLHCGNFPTFYSEQSEEGQRRIRKTLNKADYFLIVTKKWTDFVATLVPLEKIAVLDNTIVLPPQSKTDFNNRNILVLSRLSETKGLGELLAIFPKIIEKFPDARLYLGGSWENEELEKRATMLGDTVKILGWIGDAEKEEYKKLCSTFVLPTHFEAMPISILEAMAAGMAILSTNAGGIPDVITDGIEGRLVAPKDEEALSKGLVELLESEDVRRKFGEAARKRAESRVSIYDNVEKLCRVYRSLKG